MATATHRTNLAAATRPFSSFSDRLRSLLSGGGAGGASNPLLAHLDQRGEGPGAKEADGDDAYGRRLTAWLPKLSGLQPSHLTEAATSVQAGYDRSFAELEADLAAGRVPEGGGLGLVRALEDLSRPLHFVGRVSNLMVAVNGHDSAAGGGYGYAEAGAEVSGILTFRHGRSDAVVGALMDAEQELEEAEAEAEAEDGARGGLRAVRALLSDAREGGHRLLLPEAADGESSASASSDLRDHADDLSEVEAEFLDLVHLPPELRAQRKSYKMRLVELMYEMVGLRAGYAGLLGHATYADFALGEGRSAVGSVRAVQDLHATVLSRIHPIPDEVLAYARRVPSSIGDDLRIYLELEAVLGGLCRLAAALFGIVLEEVPDHTDGWHPDVRLFRVRDEVTGRVLGAFYLDPFRRRFKRPTEFVLPLLPPGGWAGSGSGSGSLSGGLPVACLGASIKPPTWDTDPVYLTADDAAALFHEFGHVLQHLLADVAHGELEGAHRIEEDASEVVSQLLEHWMFEEDFLPLFARNGRTGDPLPAPEVRRLREDRSLMRRRELHHRVALGWLELELHSEFDPEGSESVVGLQRRVAEECLPPVDVPARGDLSQLVRVFEEGASGRHGLGQYRYLYGEVLAADALGAFREAGFGDEEGMRRVGRAFRREVLERGASVPAGEAYRAFRGREATLDAFLERHGLAPMPAGEAEAEGTGSLEEKP